MVLLDLWGRLKLPGLDSGNGELETGNSFAPSTPPIARSLGAVETEFLAFAGELAAGFHQEAVGADELVLSGGVCR